MAILDGTQGPRHWEGERDAEGHRTFFLTHRVKCAPGEGPPEALNCPGLPVLGSFWFFGASVDAWAWCRPDAKAVPVEGPGEISWAAPSRFDVTQTFSTKPPPADQRRCADVPIEDPLLEPQKISGGWVKDKEEATVDRFGLPIHNSAWELIRGPQVEFDKCRGTVTVEQNVLNLEHNLLNSLKDNLNSEPLWGFPARSIKFTPGTFDRKWYGSCTLYYTRRLEFEIRVKNGPPGTFYQAAGASITATGGGYAAGNSVILVGGDGSAARFVVTSVAPFTGAVTGIALQSPGDYVSPPENPAGVTGGDGTGLALTVSYSSFTGNQLLGDWDREVLDEGTKVLKGHWGDAFGTAANNWVLDNINGAAPNPADPSHFIRFKDRQDENSTVILDGAGKPTGVVSPTKITFASSDSEPLDVEGTINFITDVDHQLVVGDQFRTIGVDPPEYNGYWIVVEVVDPLSVNVLRLPFFQVPTYISGGTLINPRTVSLPGKIRIEKYDEADLLVFGIPTVF